MIPLLKKSEVRKLFPQRIVTSHKGMNGRVLIVGGSLDFFGAPILSALGALYAGCDLVYLFVPECNFDVTRNIPDFIVRKYPGDHLNVLAVPEIVRHAIGCHSILIGPGLTDHEDVQKAVQQIVENVHLPTVLDAGAMQILKNMKNLPLPQPVVITPHMNEFERLVGAEVRETGSLSKIMVYLQTLAKDLHLNIVLKGKTDYITSDEGVTVTNETGNAGMTVGGTGDVLAGMIASLISQGANVFDACKIAAFVNGYAGDRMLKQKGYGFIASDVAHELPYTILDVLT